MRGFINTKSIRASTFHAGGTAGITWNMRQGSNHGFAAPIGTWDFKKDGGCTVTLSTAGAKGPVVADAVGFVKVGEIRRPAP